MATKAKNWKGKSSKKAQDLELPSGNEMVIKRVPMESLLAQGVIPNSLIGVITERLEKNEGKKPLTDEQRDKIMVAELEKVKDDPARLADLVQMSENVVQAVAIDPKVHPLPDDDEDRDEDLLYVDDITMEDKMYIFATAVGGNEDLESFRGAIGSGVDASEDRKKPVKATKRTTGRKRPVS